MVGLGEGGGLQQSPQQDAQGGERALPGAGIKFQTLLLEPLQNGGPQSHILAPP